MGPRTTTILVSMVVGVVAIILCCCIVLFLDRYRSAMVQNARTGSAQTASQVSSTVGNYLRDMNQAMDLVVRSMSEPEDSRNELLSAFLQFRPDVVAVTSYSEEGELLECWSLGREPREETIFESYYPWVVTMTAPLEQGGEAAWVSLDLSFSNISNHINNVGIGQRGYCFLMDRMGNIMYHPQQQLLYAGLKSEDTAALAALEDGTYVEDTVIYAVTSVEDSSWRMLSRPLRGLASAMERFERDADHFSYRPVRGTREVRELSQSFGHMVLRIQQLMSTVRQEEINLRKTELKALQAQINPHFLYNTLDSIAWMCERGRNADAVNMVHALARLFRISISRGHELIPIAKEIEHAESYLQIQKYRYKNQFTYEFDVDPECLDYYCNKITLQPIIENSINHGLDLLVEEGRIQVEVLQDGDDILFRVRDNGVGMSQEQVDAILEQDPEDRTGIGIRNVNDRLRIYFGAPYGLNITSELDVGTCVEIRMPKVREGEYEAK